jgi:hypothetical protein
MKTGTALAIGGGVLSGLLFLSTLAGPTLIMLQYLSQLPLFAVGLGLGLGPAIIASLVASAIPLAVDGPRGLIFVFAHAIPVVVLVRQALLNRPAANGVAEWYPPGPMLVFLGAYGAGAVVLASLLLSGHDGGMAGAVVELFEQTLEVLNGEPLDTISREAVAAYAFVLPAMIGVSWLIMVAVNGVLAQSLLVNFGRALRPTPAFATLRLPDWPAYVVGVAAVLWLIAGPGNIGFAAAAVLIVMLTPFFIQGLAVVHVAVRRLPARLIILIFFYMFLLFLLWPMIAVTVLGVAEQWLRLRRRLGVA